MPPTPADNIRRWREHPSTMVRELFGATPDPWQDDALECFPHSPRMAMKACKGPGKTATEAWLAWNFLLTRPHPKIAATSVSAENLADNLWTEMAKWKAKSKLLDHAFEWTKTRIFAKDHPETWWMSARSWSKTADKEQQSNTLAGLHADYIFFILDESGSIPRAVMVSAEAALSSCIEGHILQGGNPTSREGPLYEACVTNADLWKVIEITGDPDDPKRSPRISVQWARDQIRQYGRDNPWVLVNVFGKFPPSSLNALIGEDEVKAAMNRQYHGHELRGMSKVMGVDVARDGLDASSQCQRQGLQVVKFEKRRNLDSLQGAGWISRDWNDWGADACFVDATGGFGAGWIDQLRVLGRSPIGIHYSSAAHQSERYFNKRAEMYFDAVEWIRRGGALPPNSNEVLAALTQTTYTFRGDRLLLEDKDQIKLKLGYSPDECDAFVQTFAEPVTAQQQIPAIARRMKVDYDPIGDFAKSVTQSYDPFK